MSDLCICTTPVQSFLRLEIVNQVGSKILAGSSWHLGSSQDPRQKAVGCHQSNFPPRHTFPQLPFPIMVDSSMVDVFNGHPGDRGDSLAAMSHSETNTFEVF